MDDKLDKHEPMEVAPGVYKPLIKCTPNELLTAMGHEKEKAGLYGEIAAIGERLAATMNVGNVTKLMLYMPKELMDAFEKGGAGELDRLALRQLRDDLRAFAAQSNGGAPDVEEE